MADLGSAVVGVVQSIEVERGDRVRKGQVLLRLRADVERAGVESVRARAQSEAELSGAVASQRLAQTKLERAQHLQAQQFVSPEAVEQARTELLLAQAKVGQARDNLRILQNDLQVSTEQMAQRTVRSPFDGVVVERFANLGERAEEKPLLRLAAIDRLRVEVVVPIALFGQLKAGQPLSVWPELPGAGAREARIVQVDQVLDPASNTFRLRAELPNRETTLPAGLRCRVDLPTPLLRP
jgi:RND family efflux transporter MFP subunit